MQPRKVILKCGLSPGDIVMLTAAVRDLHRCHPGQFLTDVRTVCPGIWEHNPWLTPIPDDDSEAEVIECDYPLINQSNRLPYHCLHGFMQSLSERLQVPIRPTAYRGDIHIAPIEKTWMSRVHELTGEDTPFWVVVAGGKFDVPIKWWAAERFQQVIDHFREKIVFVQVGQAGHYHPPLDGVIDLRGKTNLRQLIRLIYHASGVLCPVTGAMHLAAAIETKRGLPPVRPCVVVAGGREPAHWESYPGHQFIDTIGALECCSSGGCWKSRIHPLGDGDARDERLCVDVVKGLPRCMDLIRAEEVIRRIELFYRGGALKPLTTSQFAKVETAIEKTKRNDRSGVSAFTARAESERYLLSVPKAPPVQGRGIVIPAGGARYLPCAWVCVARLRALGCRLPIQLWHLGPDEVDPNFSRLIERHGVECVDAHVVRQKHPVRRLNGWELKAYALLHSGYREVLLLDADNVPVVDPECLFETAEFKESGAIFWPDYGRLAESRPVWKLCGVPYRDEPEFESGQMVVDRERCNEALHLTMWYNEHSDFFYRFIHGDKDTFHMAFRKTGKQYAMPSTPIKSLPGVMCQHDFQGNRIFQHRNGHKWNLESNPSIPGFVHERECLEALDELRSRWPHTTRKIAEVDDTRLIVDSQPQRTPDD